MNHAFLVLARFNERFDKVSAGYTPLSCYSCILPFTFIIVDHSGILHDLCRAIAFKFDCTLVAAGRTRQVHQGGATKLANDCRTCNGTEKAILRRSQDEHWITNGAESEVTQKLSISDFN